MNLHVVFEDTDTKLLGEVRTVLDSTIHVYLKGQFIGEKFIQGTIKKPSLTSTIRLINDDIKGILEDLEIETILKEKIDKILFGDLPIRKKRIEIRKLKRKGLEPKFIKMFLNLLEYIKTV